jgi:hypothetical protein
VIERPSLRSWIQTWHEERAALTDPRSIEMVDMLIEHSEYELARDWDAVMRTVTDDAEYNQVGARFNQVVRGKDAVRSMYEEVDARIPGCVGRIEMEQEQFCIGTDSVSFAGDVYMVMAGDELRLYGLDLPDGAGPENHFLVSYRAAIFCKFEGPLVAGEDSYIGAARLHHQVD